MSVLENIRYILNTPSPKQYCHHFEDDVIKCLEFDNDFAKICSRLPTDNLPALVQIMVWHIMGDTLSFGPTMAYFSDAYLPHLEELTISKRVNPRTAVETFVWKYRDIQ